MKDKTNTDRSRFRLMVFALVLSAVLMVIKVAAWWLTDSRAVLSDAAESVVNLITGSFGVYSIWLASRPPDRNHPYGHGRIEFFAAGLNGALILAAAAGILREAIPALAEPTPVSRIGIGILLSALAGIANAGAGALLLRRGRASENLTLVAEGRHLLADTVTTAGVIVGLLLVRLTGWLILDPLIAVGIGLWIAWSGYGLLRESAARLMDEADPALLERISAALASIRCAEWIDVHLLRAWRSGQRVLIDFHLTVPAYWDMNRVHESQQQLVEELIVALGLPCEILVHPDPCSPALCRACSVKNCPVRSAEFEDPQPWTRSRLVLSRADEARDACREIQADASRRVMEGG